MTVRPPGAETREDAAEPWLANRDWAARRIPSCTRQLVIIQWVLAIVWNAGAWMVLAWFRDRFDGWQAVLILLFPAVGLCILVNAVRTTVIFRRFGISMFELETLPGRIGGRLAGTIQTRVRHIPQDGFKVMLGCQEKINRIGPRRTVEDPLPRVLWQSEVVVGPTTLAMGSEGVRVPVEFGIPSHLEATGEDRTETRIRTISWHLQVSAALPGPNFAAEFWVPVFADGDSAGSSP